MELYFAFAARQFADGLHFEATVDELCFSERTFWEDTNQTRTQIKGCHRYVQMCYTVHGIAMPAKFSPFCTQAKKGAKYVSVYALMTYDSHKIVPHVRVIFALTRKSSWLDFRLQGFDVPAEKEDVLKLSSAFPMRIGLRNAPSNNIDFVMYVQRSDLTLEEKQMKAHVMVESSRGWHKDMGPLIAGVTQVWRMLDNSTQKWSADIDEKTGRVAVSTFGFPTNVTVSSSHNLTVVWLVGLFQVHYNKERNRQMFRHQLNIHDESHCCSILNPPNYLNSKVAFYRCVEDIQKISWKSANRTCRNKGFSLPVTRSRSETDRLLAVLKFKFRYIISFLVYLGLEMASNKRVSSTLILILICECDKRVLLRFCSCSSSFLDSTEQTMDHRRPNCVSNVERNELLGSRGI